LAEIKAVRKRKEKLKDLEGIDTSNIIEEPRGRRSRASANSFFAPRRNDPVDLGDEDEEEEEDEDGEDNSEGGTCLMLQKTHTVFLLPKKPKFAFSMMCCN
jgi:hypothetical protein